MTRPPFAALLPGLLALSILVASGCSSQDVERDGSERDEPVPRAPAPDAAGAANDAAVPVPPADTPAWLALRDGLPRTAEQVAKGGQTFSPGVRPGSLSVTGPGKVRAAFLGGRISRGYHQFTEDEIQFRPAHREVMWRFHDGALDAGGPSSRLFRYPRDAAAPDPKLCAYRDLNWPDGATLVIVEATAGGAWGDPGQVAWELEGIARSTPQSGGTGPGGAPDLLFVHFPTPETIAALRAGETPAGIAAAERVAERYGIPSVNVAAEIARRIEAGELTSEEYFDDRPPLPRPVRERARPVDGQTGGRTAGGDVRPGGTGRAPGRPAAGRDGLLGRGAADGTLFLAGEPVAEDDLQDQLAAEAAPGRGLTIRSAAAAPYDRVVFASRTASAAGFAKITLAADR